MADLKRYINPPSEQEKARGQKQTRNGIFTGLLRIPLGIIKTDTIQGINHEKTLLKALLLTLESSSFEVRSIYLR